MPLKIVRNDITKMDTEAIVNTASESVSVGSGCDYAIYMAAGYEELLNYRKDNIGKVNEGDAFITPGFNLKAKYVIHAVSPYFYDGKQEEEEKLRLCYKNSLKIAKENKIKSIAFPLISTGSFGYPKEQGMRIAVDEINLFLLDNYMDIILVVFDDKSTDLGNNIYPGLQKYIDQNYVENKSKEEYGKGIFGFLSRKKSGREAMPMASYETPLPQRQTQRVAKEARPQFEMHKEVHKEMHREMHNEILEESKSEALWDSEEGYAELETKLSDRLSHLSDSFSEYLLYLIKLKGMENSEVYKRAIVDKKTFSKIKNNPAYHPQKITALCLCVGARLNLDETKDLLARAGYALSPCDMTDIIFSFFIEHEHFDIIDIDIQLEEYGLPCIIS